MSERVELLLAAGRTRAAYDAACARLSRNAEDATAHATVAYCLLLLDQAEESLKQARAARALDPDDLWVCWVHGFCAAHAGELDEAERAIREYLAADPEDEDGWWLAARCSSFRDDWKQCLEQAERGLACDPDDAACHHLRTEALRELHRYDEAEAAEQDALRSNPGSDLAHAGMGWSQLHLGRPDAALDRFREALRLDPDSEWAREGLLHSLRARQPAYRWALRVALRMRRYVGLVWIALALVWIVVRTAATAAPQPWRLIASLTPMVLVFSLGAALSGSNVFNALLRFDEEGRRILGRAALARADLHVISIVAALGAMLLALFGVDASVVITFALGTLMLQPLLALRWWPREPGHASVRATALPAFISGALLLASAWGAGAPLLVVVYIVTWMFFLLAVELAGKPR